MIKKRSLPFIVLKILILNIFFTLNTRYADSEIGYILYAASVLIMTINYYLIRDLIGLKHYVFLVLLFFNLGLLQDTLLIYLGILDFKNGAILPPLWIPIQWMLFLAFYGDVFNKMLYFPVWLMSLLGVIGGCLAYYRGLHHLNVIQHSSFYYIIGAVWAVFMPISLKLFLHFKRIKSKVSLPSN